MKDVIIVLANGINPDSTLPPAPYKRVEKGVELYRAGRAPKIIMSGKYSFWFDHSGKIPPATEADVMKRVAVSMSIPAEDVIEEDESKDTVGNAYFTKKKFLEPNNWKNVLVVTSEFHAKRTKFIFDTVLGPEYDIEYISTDDGLTDEERVKVESREDKVIEILKRTILEADPGDDERVHHLMLTKHPGYAKNSEISFEQLASMISS